MVLFNIDLSQNNAERPLS